MPSSCPGWATMGLGCPGCHWPPPVTAVHFSSRCSFSKVSASPCYLLPALPPGSPASALHRLHPASRGPAPAGADPPHGPRAPAQRSPPPALGTGASPALPGRGRTLLPTSGASPAIPPPATASRGPAPPAHAPSQVRRSGPSPRMLRSDGSLA